MSKSKVAGKSRATSARVYDSLFNYDAKKKAKQNAGASGSGAAVEQVVQKLEKVWEQEVSSEHRPLPEQRVEVAAGKDLTVSRETGASSGELGENGHSDVLNGASYGASGKGEQQVSGEFVKPKNINDVALDLISKESIMCYFSEITEERAADVIEEKLDEEDPDLLTSLELSKAKERGEHRFAHLCDFPLRVILTPLSRGGLIVSKFAKLLEMQFGPLHASLQVGNVILEWNDSSLVVPHFCKHEDQLLQSDFQGLSKWSEFTSKQYDDVRSAVTAADYQKQIDLVYRVTAEKYRQIEALADVIIKYNKIYYYNLFDRNCQHFVADALKALGVENPSQFTGGLRDYFKELKKGRSPSLHSKFASHADLDGYVKEKEQNGEIAKMKQNDLEFLLAQCFRFHVEQKSRLQDSDEKADLSNWICEEPTCCMQRLEHLIRFETLRIHDFKAATNT